MPARDVRQLAEVIEPPPLPQPVCRDPDDDRLLALALSARTELIVSGDDDLLSLGRFEGIAIVAPTEAVKLIEATGKTTKRPIGFISPEDKGGKKASGVKGKT